MKIEEAKSEILREWRNWRTSTDSATYQEKTMFYNWLQSKKPHLLLFTCSGDKWQRVIGWL